MKVKREFNSFLKASHHVEKFQVQLNEALRIVNGKENFGEDENAF